MKTLGEVAILMFFALVMLLLGISIGTTMTRQDTCSTLGGEMAGKQTCVKNSQVIFRW